MEYVISIYLFLLQLPPQHLHLSVRLSAPLPVRLELDVAVSVLLRLVKSAEGSLPGCRVPLSRLRLDRFLYQLFLLLGLELLGARLLVLLDRRESNGDIGVFLEPGIDGLPLHDLGERIHFLEQLLVLLRSHPIQIDEKLPDVDVGVIGSADLVLGGVHSYQQLSESPVIHNGDLVLLEIPALDVAVDEEGDELSYRVLLRVCHVVNVHLLAHYLPPPALLYQLV